MNKPNGYDETVIYEGGYTPVEVGGHTCIVKQVSEKQTSTGKDMIVVLFDFDKADDQPGYFMDSFKNDDRDDKKWPYQGTRYIMTADYKDPSKTSRDFKSFCTSIERSNGCSVEWGVPNWGKQFVGKKIGAVYGLVENEYNGQIYTKPQCRWFCEYEKAKSQKVPATKYAKGSSAVAVKQDIVPLDDDTELPF